VNLNGISAVGKCERIVVTTGDGRVFDLGPPTSKLFKLRVWAYKKRRGIK
jgi:hypothetical protein